MYGLSNDTLDCNSHLMEKIKILAFYHFTDIESPPILRATLYKACRSRKILGSILIAPEGINGTVAGSDNDVDSLLTLIKSFPGCQFIENKYSFAEIMPFRKLQVRLKKEIVTMRQPDVRPSQQIGKYINPKDWNDFIGRDDVVIIDTRNDYEVSIGTFIGSINPKTKKFSDFPTWWDKNYEKYKDKKIAMFCTGGIRCEKSTNFLLQRHLREVYHLRGGILKYLEVVSEKDSKWKGECFVFDQRVSVKHGLVSGTHSLCYACRRPISEAEKLGKNYEEGVSCNKCYEEHSEIRKKGFRERQRQILLESRKMDKLLKAR